MASTPYGSNTYIPEVTTKYQIEYSRNPNDFALPNWCQYIPVDKQDGKYHELTNEQAGRILDSTNADALWADGADSPAFNDETESFIFNSYSTKRYARGFNVGDLASQQAAGWDVIAANGRVTAQRSMTGRSVAALNVAQTTGNWAAAHTADVTAITGNLGRWDQSTTARSDIKRSINHAVEQIMKASLSTVKHADLRIVMSPNCARQISESQEIIDYVKGSTDAYPMIDGKVSERTNKNTGAFGLPAHLYNVEVVIEDTVRVTSRKGATDARSFACTNDLPFICARPGGLMAPQNTSRTFSTFALFLKEDMTVESHRVNDNWDRKEMGRVVDDWDFQLTAGITGFLFQNAVA